MYNINENYFLIWSNKMAYILGYICADGYIKLGPRNGGVMEITLKYRDRYILKFISKEISNNTVPIKTRIINNKKYARLIICRRKIVDDLLKLGITENKSLTLKKVKINKKYFLSFFLGFFDGDGYIRIVSPHDRRFRGYSYDNIEITLTSTLSFLQQIHSSIKQIFHTKHGKIKDCTKYYNAFVFRLNGVIARKLLLLCYKATPIFLKRKKQILNNFYNKNKLRNLSELRLKKYADLSSLS